MYNFSIDDYYPASTQLSSNTARIQVTRNLNRLASLRLKELLETKHLYQKVSIDPKGIVAHARSRVVQLDHIQAFENWSRTDLPLTILSPALHELLGPPHDEPLLTLILTNVKLCCQTCGRREAFVPQWNASFPSDGTRAPGFQVLLLTYQCQGCQTTPEALLVRRRAWELELHGRSPMEQVEVPKYIPKPEYNFFRDSVIAFNSGKVLAGLFYLRSFLEQFARRVTGDEVMSEYGKTLPPTLRDSMPSLRDWYDKLSEPIHAAKDDSETFEAARAEIEKHFDIRRVHAIPETSAVPRQQSERVNDK